jgi:SSS family solute:Na+ symporter
MVLGGIAFFVIVDKLGGLDNAMAQVAAKHSNLLIRGDHISPIKMLTYTCMPLSVGMFPHLFTHWLTAKSARTFRWPLMFYPLCIAVVWLPSVLLGIFGHLDFPGLKGPAANSVLVKMIDMHAPGVLAGLLAAGVFAAIMSSLDSQVLSISNMFTQDIVRHYRKDSELSEKDQVLWGRLFVFFIFAVAYGLSLVSARSIFTLAVWSFTGFASLFPIIVAALFWRRSSKVGAFASVITVAVLWSYFFFQGWKVPGYTVGMTGVMPVAVILTASAAAMVIGSLMSKPPKETTLEKFF